MTDVAPDPVERRFFDLSFVPLVDRETAWRDITAASFDLSGLPRDLTGSAYGYQLGPVRFTDSIHPSQTLQRTAARVRRDGMNAVMCSVELSEGFGAVVDGVEVDVGVQQVTFWDLSRPVTKLAGAGRTVCVLIDRDALRATLPSTDGLHGLTLESMGALAADHLGALARNLPTMPQSAAAGVGRATVELLAACAKPTVSSLEQARPTLNDAILRRADAYIRSKMQDPDLSPEQIARAVGVSRASLYRLFAPLGGVANHVREQRLKAAYKLLLNAEGVRRVGEVAFLVGFTSESSFSRAFRGFHGCTPSEVRLAPDSRVPVSSAPSIYA